MLAKVHHYLLDKRSNEVKTHIPGFIQQYDLTLIFSTLISELIMDIKIMIVAIFYKYYLNFLDASKYCFTYVNIAV